MDEDQPIEIPITPELDLHTFRPSEIAELLPEYFRECRERGILRVRVIHGKGSGTLRETVHRLLLKIPDAISFQYPAEADAGSWGATWVNLRPLDS
jgi:DNA-nicking Smr family endonuclease